MEWKSGRLGKNIELTKRLDGNPVSKETVKCRCGETLNLSALADKEIGGRLVQGLKNLEDRAEWFSKWNRLMEQGRDDEIALDKFFEEYTKLFSRYNAAVQGAREFSESVTISCPKCLTPFGKLNVALRLVNQPEPMELTKTDIIKLKPSPEVMAFASKRLQFDSIEELQHWLNDEDTEKAKGILEKTISELEGLALDYDTSYIISTIRTQIAEINAETRRRKVEFTDAIQKIMEERVAVIT